MKGLVRKDLKLLSKMDNKMYDSWRYNFSESDLPGIHVKVTPSQELSDAIIRISKEKRED